MNKQTTGPKGSIERILTEKGRALRGPHQRPAIDPRGDPDDLAAELGKRMGKHVCQNVSDPSPRRRSLLPGHPGTPPSTIRQNVQSQGENGRRTFTVPASGLLWTSGRVKPTSAWARAALPMAPGTRWLRRRGAGKLEAENALFISGGSESRRAAADAAAGSGVDDGRAETRRSAAVRMGGGGGGNGQEGAGCERIIAEVAPPPPPPPPPPRERRRPP